MNLIASADSNWGIGYQGNLLFRIPDDTRWFKQHTIGRVVIMGRETYESLPKGKPLADRVNIVLSSNPELITPGFVVVSNIKELFAKTADYPDEDLFVIGGAVVYEQLLPYCAKAYITKFHKAALADRFLPDFDKLSNWHLADSSEDFRHDDLCYTFCTYKNDAPITRP